MAIELSSVDGKDLRIECLCGEVVVFEVPLVS
jgi:hypothetical protein